MIRLSSNENLRGPGAKVLEQTGGEGVDVVLNSLAGEFIPKGLSVLRHNGLEVDNDTRTVTVRGEELVLTRSEFDLLHELLRSSGAVRTKGDLVRVVRGQYYRTDTYISEADERAIEVHIANLRQKLARSKGDPDAGIDVQADGVEGEAAAEVVAHHVRHTGGLRGVVEGGHEQAELVASEAGHGA